MDQQKDLEKIFLEQCYKIKKSSGITEQLIKLQNTQTSSFYRGTCLRGVSKNGRCNWQILSMNEGAKAYLGTVDNCLKAAILYDIFSIQAKGKKAKTNFNYTKREFIQVLKLPSLILIKNEISEHKSGNKPKYMQ